MIYGQGEYVVTGRQHPYVVDAITNAARRFYCRKRRVKFRTRRLTARTLPALVPVGRTFHPVHPCEMLWRKGWRRDG